MMKHDRKRMAISASEIAGMGSQRLCFMEFLNEAHNAAMEMLEEAATESEIFRAQGAARVIRELIHKIEQKKEAII